MEIKKEGYKVFEYSEPKMINKLKSLSYTLKAKVGDSQIVFDPKNKESNIYNFNPNDIVQIDWVQELIADQILINIAGNYLGTNPIFDFAAMWWSTIQKNKMMMLRNIILI